MRHNLPAGFLAAADDVRVQVFCPPDASKHGWGAEACATRMLCFMKSEII